MGMVSLIASIISIIVSIVLGVLAIWLSITFYRMSTQQSERIGESAKIINSGVERLEKLFDKLYTDTFSMTKETVEAMRHRALSINVEEQKASIPQEPIRGTPVEFLEHLSKNKSDTKSNIEKKFYNKNKEILETIGFTFDTYLLSLRNFNLISIEKEDVTDPTVTITPFGIEFLEFLKSQGYDKGLKTNL